jgi:RNA polymerase sigma-70 factor (ECF subfamily)
MSGRSHNSQSPTGPGGQFSTTHWSVVLAAGDPGSASAAESLEILCRTYWQPLYVFVRGSGYSAEDAKDLTQDFFLHLLRSDSLAHASSSRGRFRSFLLGAMKHFMADARDRKNALKRGGGKIILSVDWRLSEQLFARETVNQESPDVLFERRWALTLLQNAVAHLKEEYSESDRQHLFEVLKKYVTSAAAESSYSESAAELGISESAVKSSIFRIRRRYRELVRDEVAQTVAGPEELEDEILHLMTVFSQP